jgi:hypothetical protein
VYESGGDSEHDESKDQARWCVNRPAVARLSPFGLRIRIRLETGMPSPIIRLSTFGTVNLSSN